MARKRGVQSRGLMDPAVGDTASWPALSVAVAGSGDAPAGHGQSKLTLESGTPGLRLQIHQWPGEGHSSLSDNARPGERGGLGCDHGPGGTGGWLSLA